MTSTAAPSEITIPLADLSKLRAVPVGDKAWVLEKHR